MLQGYLRRANTFQWDTSTTKRYNGSVEFHTKLACSQPDLIIPGYFDNTPDNAGAIWIKHFSELRPRIIEFLDNGIER